MRFLTDNFFWMAFNSLLALVPVLLVVFLRLRLSRIVHLVFFFLWLIFLPNTIYLVTDLQHLPGQLFRSGMLEQALLILQFVTLAVVGVITYVYSLEPVTTIFRKMRVKEINKEFMYFFINYLVAFGVILGKTQRTHSWYIFTEPVRVVQDITVVVSNSGLMLWVLVFGTIINVLFFTFKGYFPVFRKKRR